MAKKKRLKSETIRGSFLPLRHDMMESPAFRSLSANARAVYLMLGARHNGGNNGEIGLAYSEIAKELGIAKTTAGTALRQLIERGLIRVTQESSFTWKAKTSRRYRLTAHSMGGQRPTDDWKNWTPPRPENQKPVAWENRVGSVGEPQSRHTAGDSSVADTERPFSP